MRAAVRAGFSRVSAASGTGAAACFGSARLVAPRTRAARIGVALLAVFVTACASLPPPQRAFDEVDTTDIPFAIAGRLSARRGDAGVAGGFIWTHDLARDSIDLATPLGQTLARLTGDSQGVSVQLQDGRVERASSWRELTEKAFGVTIPVDGMAAWVRAVPRARAPYSIERDSQGRVSLIRQDGWEIVYTYADDASRRPSRVVLTLPGGVPVDVRVVVDRFDAQR